MGTRTIESKPGVQPRTFSFKPGQILNLARQNSATKYRFIQLCLLIADFLMVCLTFWLAYKVRFSGMTSQFFAPDAANDVAFYTTYVFLLIPLWLLLFKMFKLYDPAVLFAGPQEYMFVFNACTVGIMLVIVVIFLDTTLVIARGWLLVSWLLSITLVGLERFMVRRVVFSARRSGHFLTPTYIVGANNEGIAIAEHLISAPIFGINVIGFLDDDINVGEEILPGIAVHGPTWRAEELCTKFGIERMIVATSGVDRDNLLGMFKQFVNVDDVAVWLSSGMYEMLTTGVRVQDIGSMAMISVNRVRLTGFSVFTKSLLDIFGATMGLIALAPLFLAIVIVMKRTDPGPIIYRRRVVGVGGKEFDAFKFRTMVVNAKEVLEEYLANNPEARKEWELHEKLKDDPRVTKIGQFLRKTSVDELPPHDYP
jgi:hypothetical protein